jgi:hypothetical protein
MSFGVPIILGHLTQVAHHSSGILLNPYLPQIVFDECHKAKNASSTKMGKAVLDLQNKLPLARVVYASATGRGRGDPH